MTPEGLEALVGPGPTAEEREERFVWNLFAFLLQAGRVTTLLAEQGAQVVLMAALWGVPRFAGASALLDHVLYYVEGEPAFGPSIMSGRLIRKTGADGSIRPATQADVDAWDPEWAPLAFGEDETFLDGTRPTAAVWPIWR